MATLYRQYRPQTFAQVSGQSHITTTLRQAVAAERIAHAYLFHGPRGTGKTTTARIFAKRLNCTEPAEGEPCGTCVSCQAIVKNASVDVLEIDAASNRGIDDIRALKEGINLKPAQSTYKVYIIDEVHMLTNEAFTALLKTLEEPVAHAVFVLATTELHKVPETIVSRCQVFQFRRATTAELQARLQHLLSQEQREVPDEVLQFVIHRSDGCYRDAESLLGQLLSLGADTITLQTVTDFLGLPPQDVLDRFLAALVRGESGPALAAIEDAFSHGVDPEHFLSEAIRLYRDAAVTTIQGESTTWQFMQEEGAVPKSATIIRALLQAVQDLAYVPQPLLALQLAVLSVCTHKGATPVSTAASQPTSVKEPSTPAQPTVSTPAKPRTQPAPAQTKNATPPQPESTHALTPDQSDSPPENLSAEAASNVWPGVIAAMKTDNPVASTFLRAMKPVAYEDARVTVQATYALHRNFFEKPQNKRLLEKHLGAALQNSVTVQITFAEPAHAGKAPAKQPVAAAQTDQEKELLSAVKDVFG